MRFCRWLIVTSLFLSCYDPQIQDGQQQCSADGKCASGFYCYTNNHCYHNGAIPTCNPACTTPKRICDITTFSCVNCLTDGHCDVGQICANQTCVPGCSTDHPSCQPDGGSCDRDLGVCRGCAYDSECHAPTPHCQVNSGICITCPDAGSCT